MEIDIRLTFKQWYGKEDDNTHTISGKKFTFLMELCFQYAIYFSLHKATWTYDLDNHLENALKPYKVKEIKTDHWHCYIALPEYIKNEVPLMEIYLYKACENSKYILLEYTNNLFFESNNLKLFSSLEDLCFFQEYELSFGTVSHEMICSAKKLSSEFSNLILQIADFRETKADFSEQLSLKEFL